MSQFSPELCKLESSNMVYICRMSDCIVELRLRVMALIFFICIQFSFFPYVTLTLKICVGFSGIFKARLLKLGIHMDNELYCGTDNHSLLLFVPLLLLLSDLFIQFSCTVLQFSLQLIYLLLFVYSCALLK